MGGLSLGGGFFKKRVVIAVSGGVDSAVALCLLREAGAEVVAATMSLYDGKIPIPSAPDGTRASCYGPDEEIDIAAAKSLCDALGIEHKVVPLGEEYEKFVLGDFRREYLAGRTPNPCVRCNENVKLGSFVKKCADAFGPFDFFATGHYARIFFGDADFFKRCGYDSESSQRLSSAKIPFLMAARDEKKDQSYFLHRVKGEILRKVRFPLGDWTKEQIVRFAREKNLSAASRKESQDFIPKEFFPLVFAGECSRSGNFVDSDGTVLGRHSGIENYTVGQRRGLGVSASQPLYVAKIDAEKNEIVLAKECDIAKKIVFASRWHWPAGIAPQSAFRAKVKIRAASAPADAEIEILKKTCENVADATENQKICCKITFDGEQRAVAPGQSAVAYVGGVVVGGGIIERAE